MSVLNGQEMLCLHLQNQPEILDVRGTPKLQKQFEMHLVGQQTRKQIQLEAIHIRTLETLLNQNEAGNLSQTALPLNIVQENLEFLKLPVENLFIIEM